MNFNSIDDIRESGFDGFVTISELQKSDCCRVPTASGVYFVLRPNTTPPEFCNESKGGHFKGKDPKVKVGCLQSEWVEDALVLSIGKAGTRRGRATLRSRLKTYIRFGKGKRVGHWGGRYIWQLLNSSDLLVCWRVEREARNVEKGLIKDFERRYCKLPFANLSF